ncbi:hypothetical protein M405DRAFT_931407 [Rhizopogon salebrosus TDB-379]|nr:hypothetical protein M405DRAFT_931407 [Rhizopogon salebrosus TDB-379]
MADAQSLGMARTGKRKVTKDPTKGARIEAAICDTLKGVFDSFRSAVIAYNVPPQTVRDRSSGKHGTRHSLLSDAQETVLVDWCHHNSDSATPLHPRTLHGRVLEMTFLWRNREALIQNVHKISTKQLSRRPRGTRWGTWTLERWEIF